MGINLPRWEELSKDEQVPIANLPIGKTYVIVGGPGTGKTVLALYRSSTIKNYESSRENRILFLVYNKLLKQYLEDSIKTMKLPDSIANTYHSWLYNFYKEHTNERIPQLAPFKYDWEKALPNIVVDGTLGSIDHLILDEAQDFPEELLSLLAHVSKSATIFADSKQAVTDVYSNTSMITHAFGAERRVYYLTLNYRNTKEISQAAHLFYVGDEFDIPANTRRTGPKPVLISTKDSYEACRIIANYSLNNPSKVVGVLLPNHELVKSYERILKGFTNNVQRYISRDKIGSQHFSFNEDGIKVQTYNTMKGLEYDAVFIPSLEDSVFNFPKENLMRKLYVASTRAKDYLTFMYSGTKSNPVIDLLINNRDIIDFDASVNQELSNEEEIEW